MPSLPQTSWRTRSANKVRSTHLTEFLLFKSISKPGDQRCHIIGNQFGGSGSVFNFFPCNGSLNGGLLNVFKTDLKKFVAAQPYSSFKLKVSFEYNDAAFPNRPSKMIYEFFDNANSPINLPGYGTIKEFLNP
jgi:DNA/RNA non-specific endonuclease